MSLIRPLHSQMEENQNSLVSLPKTSKVACLLSGTEGIVILSIIQANTQGSQEFLVLLGKVRIQILV